MKYSFDSGRFAQIMKERKLKKTPFARQLGLSNPDTVQNWLDGKKIESTHLVMICNALGVSPSEFFREDGKPIAAPQKGEMTSTPDKNETPDASNELMKQQLERAEVEKQHMEEISNMKCEHIRELMQKDIDLAKKEVRLREEIRKEIKAEYENEMTRLRTLLIELSAKREI